jgi:hypothetical protein
VLEVKRSSSLPVAPAPNRVASMKEEVSTIMALPTSWL